MENLIYEVRKHGEIAVETKEEAKAIQVEAAFQDYNFGIKKFGWSWIVTDEDE